MQDSHSVGKSGRPCSQGILLFLLITAQEQRNPGDEESHVLSGILLKHFGITYMISVISDGQPELFSFFTARIEF